jgi:hypothetical protein
MAPVIKIVIIDKDDRPTVTANTDFCFTSLTLTFP